MQASNSFRQLGEITTDLTRQLAARSLSFWLGEAEAATNDVTLRRAMQQVRFYRAQVGRTWPQIIGQAAA